MNDDVMRTIIELPLTPLGALDALCRREGLSRAEVIRRAVDAYLRPYQQADAARAFGLWRDRGVDGLAYQESIRGEWDRPAARRERSAKVGTGRPRRKARART